jgi:hypothetical protein
MLHLLVFSRPANVPAKLGGIERQMLNNTGGTKFAATAFGV